MGCIPMLILALASTPLGCAPASPLVAFAPALVRTRHGGALASGTGVAVASAPFLAIGLRPQPRTSTPLRVSRRERERQGGKKLSRRERERLAELAVRPQGEDVDPDGADAASTRAEVFVEPAAALSVESSRAAPHREDTGGAGVGGGPQESGALDTGGTGVWTTLFGAVLPPWLVQRLEVSGFAQPTAVQAQAIDTVVVQKRDALVQAYTGSGKTLAFLIPLFAVLEQARGIDQGKRRLAGVQAVLVAPTRELALQLTKVARQLAAGCPDTAMHVMAVSSDARAKRQRIWLKADPPQVVIGDAESLLRLCEAGTLRTGSIRFLVVDEVDACFSSPATKQNLNRLLSRYLTSRKSTSDVEQRRTIFASATVRQHAQFLQLCEKNKWLMDPVHVYVDPNVKVPPNLRHTFIPTLGDAREAVVRDVCRSLEQSGPEGADAVVLVFADETRESWDALEASLRSALAEPSFMVSAHATAHAAQTRDPRNHGREHAHPGSTHAARWPRITATAHRPACEN